MEKSTAKLLIKNLIDRNPLNGPFLTDLEETALRIIIDYEFNQGDPRKASLDDIKKAEIRQCTEKPDFEILDIQINKIDIPDNIILCIDFGTAFSRP